MADNTPVPTSDAVPPPAAPPVPAAAVPAPVVVKKYANRRLYNTETSSYITLDNLADMIRAGRDFAVYDAKSGEDITRGVLTQIIVEEESKGGSMLPAAFLRQLIGFYGDSLQGVVPRYLEQAMANFARQQQQMRQVMQQTFSPFLPTSVEEIGRQNLALMERAMSMFNPFHRDAPAPAKAGEGNAAPPPPAPAAPGPEVEALKHEIENLRAQLAIARAEAVITHSVAPADAPNVLADPPVPPGALAEAMPRRPRNGRKPN